MDRSPLVAFLQRVRWHNVARASALAGLVALVVLWPHLTSSPPAVPSAIAVPVVGGSDPTPVVRAAPVTTDPTPASRKAATGRRVDPRPERKTQRRRPLGDRPRPRRPVLAPVSARVTAPRPLAAAPPVAARSPPSPRPPDDPEPRPRGVEFLPDHRDFTPG